MHVVLVTDKVFHDPIGWLKAVAEKNVPVNSKQLATFQLARFWLNPDAKAKVACILATEATFQLTDVLVEGRRRGKCGG